MRIITGALKGRIFREPHGSRTHPMSEKVRGALFNTLGDIEGLTILDAFAGSGALSFEGVSRGAKYVIAIDHDKHAARAIKENIRSLNLADKVKAINANASSWSDNNPDARFSIVILAPPYDNLQVKLLDKLTKHASGGGVLVLDWPGNLAEPAFEGLEKITNKNYGDAQLVFYRKIR
jgi:16S rRNA (guanine966-N2)-methyltransferase